MDTHTPRGYCCEMGRGIAASRRQVRSHAEFWAVPRGTGPVTYVALGDSAAQSVGVDDPREGYVHLLGRRLQYASGQHISIVNLSVSGATAEDLVGHQLPQLAQLPVPDVLTCVIGGNDVAAFRHRFRAQRFAAAARTLTHALPPHAVLGTIPSFGHWPYEGRVRAANRALREAAASTGLAVGDLYAPTRRLWPWRSLSILAGDGFHPNARGHVLWADALWPHLSV